MEVIHATNVNEAFLAGIDLIQKHGVVQESRAGMVRVAPWPVTTIYAHPQERVLFSNQRDANPFFHLMEALWMLAGERDARWLDQFVSDFSSRFAEENGMQHGAYGYRWRKHFWVGGSDNRLPDQLTTLVNILKKDPNDRRAVLSMWDPYIDLAISKKDIPCNTHAYFRVRNERTVVYGNWVDRQVLDITVCCRSNDIIWGAYGANAVHFSVLQEYMARRLGVEIGMYYQVSNNYHAYVGAMDKLGAHGKSKDWWARYPDVQHNANNTIVVQATPLVDDPDSFDEELSKFISMRHPSGATTYRNRFFPLTAIPMLQAYKLWRAKKRDEAFVFIKSAMLPNSDWRAACLGWMTKRMAKVKETTHV